MMDAVKFLEERARMCGNGCKNCPAYGDECDIYKPDCDYESLVKAVETWAAEHPRKTRQTVFLEQYPESEIDSRGDLMVCPKRISADCRDRYGNCTNRLCSDCRREFWMKEVE